MPGNTALLIFFDISSLFVKIMPPRGPRKLLWVVDVTTSAKGTGSVSYTHLTLPTKRIV